MSIPISENREVPRGASVHLIPLAQEVRAVLPTAEAAAHLNRAQQTLRLWAMRDNGPIRPVRINGRLAWPVRELRRLLGVDAAERHL